MKKITLKSLEKRYKQINWKQLVSALKCKTATAS